MRVVSGKARGLKLKTIESDLTRPTKDMVKEALFSIVRNKNQDCVFLDLFAGSGAIGIEALSEGAKMCYFCDINKECFNVITENVEKAKFIEKSKIYNLDYISILDKIKDVKFDIIYIDPPYNKGLGLDAINRISQLAMLKDDGIIVFETDEEEKVPENIGNFKLNKQKKYGRNRLNFYSRSGS